MLSKELEEEFNMIKYKISIIQKKRTKNSNEISSLNERYIVLSQEKCRENIGRCFIKMQDSKIISYCRVIDIHEVTYQMHVGSSFNAYQYPSMWFKYPYNDSLVPFYEKDLFSGAWGDGHDPMSRANKTSYVEIDNEEFSKKFKEVNDLWIDKVTANDDNIITIKLVEPYNKLPEMKNEFFDL